MSADETRRERFVRVATRRVNKILDLLDVLGNCSNPMNYEYTDEQVQQIFDAIRAEVDEVQAKFLPDERKRKKKRFTLESATMAEKDGDAT